MRNAKILLASALILGASACGFSESKYEKRASEASCQWAVDCFELFSDVDACLDADSGEEVDTSSCEYDADKAKECVDGLEALTCDDTAPPAACGEVYTNCDSSSNNTSNTSNNANNTSSNNTSSNNTTSNNTSGAE